MSAIKTAIIVDYMGSGGKTPEEEVASHAEHFSEMLDRTLMFHTPQSPDQIEAGTELVLFDFGGIMPGAEGLITSNSRSLIRWAEDHPSSLVVIISWFTWNRYVEHEMEELGLSELPNVTHSDTHDFDELVPEWWRAGLSAKAGK